MPRSPHDRTPVTASGLSYTQVATALQFSVSPITLQGPSASYTDLAVVVDQFGVAMSPQTGTVSYVSGSPSVATVGSSSGTLTAVSDGTSTVTASWFA